MGLNAVSLMGRVVADPNYRETPGQDEKEVSMALYRLAVERDYMEGNKRPVDFISCKAFGSNARYAESYFQKGDTVVVKGRIVAEEYIGENQERRVFTGVLVEKSYLAKKSAKSDYTRTMEPGQDVAGGFLPVPDEEDFSFPPVEEDFPPIP